MSRFFDDSKESCKEVVMCLDSGFVSDLIGPGVYSTRFEDFLELLQPERVCWIPRSYCEKDPSFRQVIPYVVLTTKDDEIAVYKRGTDSSESRLVNKSSIGIGGHVGIENLDLLLESGTNETREARAFTSGALKELQEEVGLQKLPLVEKCFVVNLNETDVDMVHLGLAIVCQVSKGDIMISQEPGIVDNLLWVKKDDLVKEALMKANVAWTEADENTNGIELENWSQIVLTALTQGGSGGHGCSGCSSTSCSCS